MKRVMLLLLVVTLMTGCAKKSIVGTWTTEVDAPPFRGTGEQTFLADGTFRSKARLAAANGVVINMTDSGKWRVDGKGERESVTITLTDATFRLEGGPPERLATAQIAMEAAKPAMIKQLNESSKDMPLEWAGAHEFTLTANGKASVFRRKK